MKNAAITSNIDGPCVIDALTKRSTFCTVKEIPLSGPNFPPHDDFKQHRAPGCPPQIRPVLDDRGLLTALLRYDNAPNDRPTPSEFNKRAPADHAAIEPVLRVLLANRELHQRRLPITAGSSA
jgi:hypothetical protein